MGRASKSQALIGLRSVIEHLYGNSVLYNTAGTTGMAAVDVAMAMGGCEAIVESIYSVMEVTISSQPT